MTTRSKFHLLAITLSAFSAVLVSACGVDAPANDDQTPGTVTQAVTTPTAQLYSPGNGAILLGSQVTFSWTFGTAASEYWLYVGNSFGATDILSSGPIAPSTTSLVVSNIPTDGRTIYAVMWSLTSSGWVDNTYSFIAATAGSGFVPAQLVSPGSGSTLSGGSNVIFSWTSGTGTDGEYFIALGTSPGQTDIVAGTLPGTSANLSIPTSISSVYVQLWSHASAGWHAPLLYSFAVQ